MTNRRIENIHKESTVAEKKKFFSSAHGYCLVSGNIGVVKKNLNKTFEY